MITPYQIRAARKLLGWHPSKLAEKARLSIDTINRTEKSGVATVDNMAAIKRAFESAGVEFTTDEQLDVRMRAAP